MTAPISLPLSSMSFPHPPKLLLNTIIPPKLVCKRVAAKNTTCSVWSSTPEGRQEATEPKGVQGSTLSKGTLPGKRPLHSIGFPTGLSQRVPPLGAGAKASSWFHMLRIFLQHCFGKLEPKASNFPYTPPQNCFPNNVAAIPADKPPAVDGRAQHSGGVMAHDLSKRPEPS